MGVSVRLIGVSRNSEARLRSPICWLRSEHINGVKVEPEAPGGRIKALLIDRSHA